MNEQVKAIMEALKELLESQGIFFSHWLRVEIKKILTEQLGECDPEITRFIWDESWGKSMPVTRKQSVWDRLDKEGE